jgi:hypothetical protein
VLLIEEPARISVMQNIFVLRAIHFNIGHFPFVGIFCSEGGFFPNVGYSVFLTLVTAINDQLQY